MADALHAIGVHNNWGMLAEFGDRLDAAVEYIRPAEGRGGWSRIQHTRVWARVKGHPVIPLGDKWPHSHAVKEFSGPRRDSLPAALAWATENLGCEFVPSPFGGYLPKHVVDKAKARLRLVGKEERA